MTRWPTHPWISGCLSQPNLGKWVSSCVDGAGRQVVGTGKVGCDLIFEPHLRSTYAATQFVIRSGFAQNILR